MALGDDDKSARSGNVISLGTDIVGDGLTVEFGAAKMKTARSCLEIVARMLNARLVNVGIMELYGDTLLVDTTRSVLEFAFMGPPTHVMSFTKMSRAIMNVLNKLAEQHILMLVNLKSAVFARMMGCLGIALNSQDIALSTPAGRVIEAIAIFRCRAAAQASAPSVPSQLVESNNLIFSGSRNDPSVHELRRAAQAFSNHDLAVPEVSINLFLSCCAPSLTILLGVWGILVAMPRSLVDVNTGKRSPKFVVLSSACSATCSLFSSDVRTISAKLSQLPV